MNKFKFTRVLIQAGHGGTDPGATANGTSENKECNQVILQLIPILKAAGINVIHMPDYPFVESINQVNKMALPGDWAIEVHMDSFGSYNPATMNDRIGVYHLDGSAKSKEIGDIMLASFKKDKAHATSWNRPDTASNHGSLGWIRMTKPAAHLVELGFIQDDQGNIEDLQHAKFLADAIIAVMRTS